MLPEEGGTGGRSCAAGPARSAVRSTRSLRDSSPDAQQLSGSAKSKTGFARRRQCRGAKSWQCGSGPRYRRQPSQTRPAMWKKTGKPNEATRILTEWPHRNQSDVVVTSLSPPKSSSQNCQGQDAASRAKKEATACAAVVQSGATTFALPARRHFPHGRLYPPGCHQASTRPRLTSDRPQ
jgi:hypothetical protein